MYSGRLICFSWSGGVVSRFFWDKLVVVVCTLILFIWVFVRVVAALSTFVVDFYTLFFRPSCFLCSEMLEFSRIHSPLESKTVQLLPCIVIEVDWLCIYLSLTLPPQPHIIQVGYITYNTVQPQIMSPTVCRVHHGLWVMKFAEWYVGSTQGWVLRSTLLTGPITEYNGSHCAPLCKNICRTFLPFPSTHMTTAGLSLVSRSHNVAKLYSPPPDDATLTTRHPGNQWACGRTPQR